MESATPRQAANICPVDGEVYLIRAFYPSLEADNLYNRFYRTLAWQEESIAIYGKSIKVPRLTCWYGDSGAFYRYSGITHTPLPWTPDLAAVKNRIENFSETLFNSALANLYRDGRDSMGYHADNEPELGPNPVIASLSFGANRLFRLHHNRRQAALDLILENGDLLIMAGSLQQHWRHALPKTRQLQNARINLTFRQIISTIR